MVKNCNACAIVVSEVAMVEGYIGTKEAGAISGLTTGYLRRLLVKGRIKGRRIGRDWVIERESLLQFLRIERKMGRPPIDK